MEPQMDADERRLEQDLEKSHRYILRTMAM